MKSNKIKFVAVVLITLVFPLAIRAQTTAFNYQGKLTDGGNAANGNYQMQFKLFDAVSGGTQIGGTLNDVPITAANGVFATKLDFGANALNGANRWLEIAVRRNAGEGYVTLAPREQINSSPFAVRTLSAASADNALQLGGIPASEYVTTSSVGSSFIRNGTTLQTANFNINGGGFFGNSVGIGTTTTLHRFNISNSPCWTGDCWGGAIGLENASAIGWKANTSGVRFGLGRTENGLFFFRTNAELGTMTAGPIYDFKLDNDGRVGIGNLGISTDLSNARLTLFNGGNGYGLKHTTGTVTLGTYIGGFGGAPLGGWLGTDSNHPLHFFTAGSTPQMTVNTNGNVGIGTTAANLNKLFVEGGIGQSASSYGLPKFMMLIKNNGNNPATIEKCSNTVSGLTTPPCGIIAFNQPGGAGPINIRFPFRVTDRFFSMTLMNASPVLNSFSVTGFDTNDVSGQTVSVLSQGEEDFYLIVF